MKSQKELSSASG